MANEPQPGYKVVRTPSHVNESKEHPPVLMSRIREIETEIDIIKLSDEWNKECQTK